VTIEGKPLAAGSYGLHMIPGTEEWTVIFSRNSSSWGSFFYDPAEDALRVVVKPKKSEYAHWLTYEFTDRQPAQATVALKWENLAVAWTVAVADVSQIYLAKLRQELRGSPGFNHLAWTAAATYCLQNNVNLEEGLRWAQFAVDGPGIGQEEFGTLSALGLLQAANGRAEEGQQTLARAVQHATASAGAVHQLGRQLIGMRQPQQAVKVFEENHKRHAGAWPTEVGLARGYAAVGQYDKALEHAKVALEQAPDDLNRNNLKGFIERLAEGKDIN
jgi:tetratricopeptide (TPR) repeat protein